MALTADYPILDQLRKFRDWWFGELAALVPRRLSFFFSGRKARLAVLVEEGVARLQLSSGKETRLLAVTDLDTDEADDASAWQELKRTLAQELPAGCAVEVHLPADRVLWREVTLPQATEGSLGNVLRFEFDRLTPFRSEQASHGYRLIERYPEQERIRLALAVVRQDYLDRILGRLTRMGLQPSGVYPPVEGESLPASMNMLPEERRAGVEPLFNHHARRLAVLAGFLLVAVCAYPAFQLDRLKEHLNTEIAAIRPAATIVGQKQSQLAARLTARDSLVARKNQVPTKLAIIHELTRLLPDNTWVSQLNIDAEDVELQGESLKASDLIELLERSERFQNVQFGSSITRNTSTNMERFEIRMDLSRGGP